MFKVIKILLRLAAFFAFAGLAFWLTGIENYNNTLERIEKLPDCDFRAIAESFWNRGQKAEALACLEYSISNGLPDAAACNFLRNKYLKAEENKKFRNRAVILSRAGIYNRKCRRH